MPGSDENRFGAFKPRGKSPSGRSEPYGGTSREVAAAPNSNVAAGPSDKGPESEGTPADLIEVGAVVQSYGVRGQIKVLPHAAVGNGGDALLQAPRWWVAPRLPGGGRSNAAAAVPTESLRMMKVISARVHTGTVTAALAGCDDRDSADGLRGSRIFVRRADFPALEAGEYYWVDLIGLDVVNVAGVALGRVSDLMDNGAHAVLRVAYVEEAPDVDASAREKGRQQPGQERERLIPFVDAYLRDVDLKAKRIVVDWELDY